MFSQVKGPQGSFLNVRNLAPMENRRRVNDSNKYFIFIKERQMLLLPQRFSSPGAAESQIGAAEGKGIPSLNFEDCRKDFGKCQ
jgi:hypothetical protein